MAGKARPPINPQRLKKRVDAAEDIPLGMRGSLIDSWKDETVAVTCIAGQM